MHLWGSWSARRQDLRERTPPPLSIMHLWGSWSATRSHDHARTRTTTTTHARPRPPARPSRPRARRRPAAGWSRSGWPAACCPARRRCWCCSARSRSGTPGSGVALVVAFGLGMAATLAVVGLLVMRLRERAELRLRSHPASRFAPLLRIAPLVTAVAVVAARRGAGLARARRHRPALTGVRRSRTGVGGDVAGRCAEVARTVHVRQHRPAPPTGAPPTLCPAGCLPSGACPRTRSPCQATFDELGTPLHEVTFVVVDLETTGGSPQSCEITEIGAVKVRGGEGLGRVPDAGQPGRADPAVHLGAHRHQQRDGRRRPAARHRAAGVPRVRRARRGAGRAQRAVRHRLPQGGLRR